MLHPVCALDATLTAGEAIHRLRIHEGQRFALLRRQHGTRVAWHAFERQALLELLAQAQPEQPLEDAGAERDLFAEPERVLQARRAGRARMTTARAVLLDGDRLLGWLQPDAGAERGGTERVESGPRRTPGGRTAGNGAASRPREHFDGGDDGGDGRAGSPRWFADGEPVPAQARSADAFYGFPRLSGPSTVEPGERFELAVGLADRPVRGVSGGAVVIRGIPPGTREIELDLQVVAEGFAAPGGWRHSLRVVLAEPEAAEVRVPLVALEARGTRLGCIDVNFSHRGIPCGMARRHVAIRRPGDADGGEGQLWTRTGAQPRELRVPFQEAAPDLTVQIGKPDGNPATGRLAWTFLSPHPVELPAEPVFTHLGADPATFARSLVRTLGHHEGGELGAELMEGLGGAIREVAPRELWEALREVWAAVGAGKGPPPAVLLLSAEEYVPWELALVDPPLDPARPPFLGAQAAVGRWILDTSGLPIPPPHVIQVPELAVVTAQYPKDGGHTRLPAAEREARRLAEEHGALAFALRGKEMRTLLRGSPETEGGRSKFGAVHFACHGTAGSGDPGRDALVMEDGRSLSPLMLRGARLARENPFLFLNACQTGQAGELLGMVGGFAGQCLYGGFRGFVAPFWSVMDDVAEEIAVEFYRQAFGARGRVRAPVAEILRDLRRMYREDEENVSLTPLAYVFYGHPRLVLERGARTASGGLAGRPGITARRPKSPGAPPDPPPAPATAG